MARLQRNNDTELASEANQSGQKSPRRIEAGRRNRALRGSLTEQGRERLRAAALQHQPWKNSTGPRSPEGKKQAVRNGKRRQLGPVSIRELRAELADLKVMIESMRELRFHAKGLCDA